MMMDDDNNSKDSLDSSDSLGSNDVCEKEAQSQSDTASSGQTASAETAPYTFRHKDYANPVAQCEQGIAVFLEKLPRLVKDNIKVFGNSEEGVGKAIEREVARNALLCVTVNLSDLGEVTHTQRCTPQGITYRATSQASFTVAVISPAVFSEEKTSASTDVAYAILQALDGARFSLPFLTALEFTGWEQAEYTNGVFSAVLTFTAWIGLLELTTTLGKD